MSANLKEVPIKQCVVNTDFNTRKNGVGDLTELVASIQAEGILQPLLGKERGNSLGEVEIYAGYRRLAAAEKAELDKVPVMVTPRDAISRQQMLAFNVVENIQRQTLNPVDEAMAYERLQKEHGMSTDQVCVQIGIKKNRVLQRFRLLKLQDIVRDAVHSEEISMAAAMEIDRLPKDKQAKFVGIARDLSGSRLVTLVNKELEKLQKQIRETEASEKEPDKPRADIAEHVKLIKKASSIIGAGLGYDNDSIKRVKDIDFRPLEEDDLRVVAQLFDDCADQVEDDIEVNTKAAAEIESMVEASGGELYLDEDSAMVREALMNAIFEDAKRLAQERANGKRPKVTLALAKEVLEEYYCEMEVEE